MAELEAMPNGAVAGESSKPQKGVVEEVISKRLKALTKKIIRIKAYGAQPSQSLNNDQRAAMATLPSLEAVAKELEDLIKPGGPVEVAELTQAGVLRETRDSAAAEAISIARLQLDEYSETLSKRLSQLLRLHSLVHPARPTDHQHLVNGDLNLPTHMRTEITPSDVLRIGRMYDDIRSGGEAGKAVLQQLGGKAQDLDTEDAHVLELFDLLDQPQVSVPASESGGNEASAQPQFGSIANAFDVDAGSSAVPGGLDASDETEGRAQRSRQPTDYSMHTKMSDDGLPLGASASQIGGSLPFTSNPAPVPQPKAVPEPEPEPEPVVAAPQPLVFLQEDELAQQAADPVEGIAQPVDAVQSIPQPESDSKNESKPESAETTAVDLTQDAPSDNLSAPKIDWTLDDDDDQTPIFSTRANSSVQVAPTPSLPIDEMTIPSSEPDQQPQVALIQENETPSADPNAAVEAPTSVEAPVSTPAIPQGPRASRQPTATASGSKRGKNKANGPKNGSKPAITQRPSGQKMVDDDGFEQVVKKQAQNYAQMQNQNAVRGGGRGRGGGGERGRGGGGGGQRGRGDRGRGLPRNPSQGVANGGAGLPPKPSAPKAGLFKSDVVPATSK